LGKLCFNAGIKNPANAPLNECGDVYYAKDLSVNRDNMVACDMGSDQRRADNNEEQER